MTRLQAVLWDVDGTIAETERDGHRVAFNLAFQAFGLSWHWDEARYGELLSVTGGRERMLVDMARHQDAPAMAAEREQLARELHARKNAFYAEIVGAGRLPLREGVAALMDECAARGLRMGITTTTSRSNVEALMRAHLGPRWAERFGAVVCGEDVAQLKPDPEVFELALQGLGIGPLEAVAIEDSPGGAASARAAHVPVIVTPSAYFADATIEGAIAIGPGFHDRRDWRPALDAGAGGNVRLDDVIGWHAEMDSVSQFG